MNVRDSLNKQRRRPQELDFDTVVAGTASQAGPISALFDVVGGLSIAGSMFIVITRMLRWTTVDYVVLSHAVLPITLLPAWLGLAIAAARRQLGRSLLAGSLCLFYLVALVPALGSDPLPTFAKVPLAQQERLTVFSSNTYVDNRSDLVATFNTSRADVFVLTEFDDAIEARLVAGGVFDEFPYVADNGANSTWRSVIRSRFPFDGPPRIIEVPGSPLAGTPLVAADIVIPNRAVVRVIAAHPAPLTVPGSDDAFRSTVRTLLAQTSQAQEDELAVVIAGDFNGTRWLWPTSDLFRGGLASVHEARGRGLSTSWPNFGGTPPFMRLDHVFFDGPIAAIEAVDVQVPGSDHEGIRATFVVAPPRGR
jgi:endonuclease/exonuclease/phosphatase (EEP) superfamily protein YafD